ncbi:hypothetical protein E3N88_10278 [Mikania micrantha]|uniref:Leucine-rich repeat-containing N-terminal plant-type domain-containing protein n=1 Tax=Mikania micrantha TaxID=192012 RepID=A0A5N6PCG2_9ASTR|nr:hypothetical protein E3N88_10278 [Mikania micrantha]
MLHQGSSSLTLAVGDRNKDDEKRLEHVKVRKFNGIYSQKWQTRRSGQSDAMIEREAEEQYREEFNAHFSLQRKTTCVEQDRLALLRFKRALVDDYGLLNSWKNTNTNTTTARDCCRWRGVGCNNATGQVITLDLSGTWSEELEQILGFTGEIDSSLLSLSALTYLDLSGNSFTRIPNFIGSLKHLQHLKLSNIELTSPEFPDQLRNLSSLQTLDLSATQVVINNSNWLSGLSSLKYLNLSYIDLSGSVGLLNTATKLPSLVELQLVNCLLPNDTAFSFHDPLTNLSDTFSVLDLSSNYLSSSTIYPWLFNFSACLTDILVSHNELSGTIPESFGMITNLKTLDLNNNGLKGGIPSSFVNLSGLRELHLSGNNLDQDLPSLFDNLPVRSLQILDLYGNQLSGSIPDFSVFSALMKLYLGQNQLNGSFPGKFKENSSLLILDLADNRINGLLPDLSGFGSLMELYLERNLLQGNLAERLGSISNLESLGASSNFFQGTITEQHVANLSSLIYLDLSYNSLALELGPDWSAPFQLDVISLSSCKLGSLFPKWLKTQNNFSVLDISNAGINDTVPGWFWNSLNTRVRYLNLSLNQIHGVVPDLIYGKQPLIDLSSNNLSGSLPLFPQDTIALIVNNNMFSGSVSSLCNLTTLNRIDLSNNKLSGNIPNCWNRFDRLLILNLENNLFIGSIPDSIGSLQFVSMMSMRDNDLTGEIPLSLGNCTGLQLLDLGENRLSGKIPEWIGESLSTLRVLSLPSNRFYGTIPTSLCMLEMIQILDLSFNNISGSIPKCLDGFIGMRTRGTPDATIEYNAVGLERTRLTSRARYVFKALLQWKGRQSEYQKTLDRQRLRICSSADKFLQAKEANT